MWGKCSDVAAELSAPLASGVQLKIIANPGMRAVILVASMACIGMAGIIGIDIGWFVRSSATGGADLIHQARRAIAAATPALCRSADARGIRRPAPGHRTPATAGSSPHGLLEAPALGLVAPVEEGTSDAVLQDAVGHVRASAWPGRHGTTVFAAHDVTWFSRIDRLKAGDVIRYVTQCRAYVYRVTSHRVVNAGYPVYRTNVPRIILDTCYPLDALFPTPTRYLVYARLTSITQASPRQPLLPRPPLLAVPAPPALAAQGLGLRHNEAPLGRLHVAGSPLPVWSQSSRPLEVEAAALATYFGAVRSAGQAQRQWWHTLAPSVPVRAAGGLWRGEIAGYNSHLDVTLRVAGNCPTGATLAATVTTSGSARPGTYHLTVTEALSGNGMLVVTGFRMRRLG